MPSRLSHCLLFAFIGIALVQTSYAWALRSHSSAQSGDLASAQSSIDHATSDLQESETALQQLAFPPQITCLTSDDSAYVSFGKQAGQFGTSDFSVDFWVKSSENSGTIFDLLGNRFSSSHGNFFVVRMWINHRFYPRGTITAEVDQDGRGTNYIITHSQTGLNDGQWQHVAVVRQANTLSLYINGSLAQSNRASGVANIDGAYDLKIGRSVTPSAAAKWSGAACYSGPRIERRAWSDKEVATKYTTTRPE